jgi:hypothetical protein
MQDIVEMLKILVKFEKGSVVLDVVARQSQKLCDRVIQSSRNEYIFKDRDRSRLVCGV